MVVHVYKRAKLASVLADVIVATDSEKIKAVVEGHGGKAILTAKTHQNGTERIGEAARSIECDYVVLINGDEALLNPEYIRVSVDTLINSDASVSLLVNEFTKVRSPSDFKVVLNLRDEVMYISRADIPSDARHPVATRLKAYHIMTFRKAFLETYAQLPKSPMEAVEDHEHLRVIENGYKIKAARVESVAVSVDTPDDLEFTRQQMVNDRFYRRYA